MAGEIKLNSVNFASESGGTITVNNGTIGSSVVFPAGTVLQVLQSVKTDTDSTTNTIADGYDFITGTDQTGSGSIFSVVITPKASGSHFFITAAMTLSITDSNIIMLASQRDGTTLTVSSGGADTNSMFHSYLSGSTSNSFNFTMQFLDKNANAVKGTNIIYRPVICRDGGSATIFVNRLSAFSTHLAISTFTVMEIAT
jgi:hypothetical protein